MSDNPKMMDATMPETDNPTVSTNSPRNCWAIETLVGEVEALFPDATYETSNVDGRNTALDVQFVIGGEPDPGLEDLLALVGEDERVREVISDKEGTLVSFYSNARTQDSREPFGLADAWSVLAEQFDNGSL